jgi:hypothetical protein
MIGGTPGVQFQIEARRVIGSSKLLFGREQAERQPSMTVQRVPSAWREGGTFSDFKAMNEDEPHAERTVYRRGQFPRTAGVEVGKAKGLNEMETNPNGKKALTDEAYYVNAADLADKSIVLMQQGLDPFFLSISTWAVVQADQCQAVN